MPPKKKTKVAGNNADNDEAVAVHQLEDIVANILGWLGVEEIMQKRRVCKKWKEAARKTIVPLCNFCVSRVQIYNALNVMASALPNLQQIAIGALGHNLKYSDGEDPDEELAADTANWTTHDIGIISNFGKLRILEIGYNASLNGRYPALFSFPLLQKLSIKYCTYLTFDLEMLAGLPLLKKLNCSVNSSMTGNINSLRVLKDTLEVVCIESCPSVEGNFMDLADFPQLKELSLLRTAVTGDIRDISEHDFSSLERLDLPKKGVYGMRGYEIQRISGAPDLVRAVYAFNKQRPALRMSNWYGKLSKGSLDWYESVEGDDDTPPFYIRIVEAGSRLGYRWQTQGNNFCEVNWLDPEPDRESSDYGQYIVQVEEIQDEIGMYRGFHQPPTEEEYIRLIEG
jgi:hypothetical protein